VLKLFFIYFAVPHIAPRKVALSKATYCVTSDIATDLIVLSSFGGLTHEEKLVLFLLSAAISLPPNAMSVNTQQNTYVKVKQSHYRP
jgi:hypothetical protein